MSTGALPRPGYNAERKIEIRILILKALKQREMVMILHPTFKRAVLSLAV
jgi:hypothetical protein